MNILITGAGGPAAVGVIKSLKGLNTFRHKLIAVDSDELAVGLHLCSAGYVIPKINEENYYDELKKVIKKENIDLILPTSDDVIPISMMKKIYFNDINLFMSDYHSIATCHNKMLFYKKCSTDFRLPYTSNKFIPVFEHYVFMEDIFYIIFKNFRMIKKFFRIIGFITSRTIWRLITYP